MSADDGDLRVGDRVRVMPADWSSRAVYDATVVAVHRDPSGVAVEVRGDGQIVHDLAADVHTVQLPGEGVEPERRDRQTILCARWDTRYGMNSIERGGDAQTLFDQFAARAVHYLHAVPVLAVYTAAMVGAITTHDSDLDVVGADNLVRPGHGLFGSQQDRGACRRP